MSCQLCTDENHYSCAVSLCGLFGQESCCCGWMTEVEFNAAVAEAKKADFADDAWHR